MKQYGKLIDAFLLIAMVAMLALSFGSTTGCSHTANERLTVDPVKAQRFAAHVKSVAANAVLLAHIADTNSTPYFAMAREVLRPLEQDGVVTPQKIRDALSASSAKELRTPEAQLQITAVLMLYDAAFGEVTRQGIGEREGVRILFEAAMQGLDAGLRAVEGMR